MPADLVLVVSERNRGWVLDTMCKQIAAHSDGAAIVHYGIGHLPRAKAYFYSHYSLFAPCMRRNPLVRLRRNVVFFTHPSHDPSDQRGVIRQLRRADVVVSMSTVHGLGLVAAGLPEGKMRVVLPGTDPEAFAPHTRGAGAVGLSSAYYPRKNPDLLAAVVRALPHREFQLIGRRWREWQHFDALDAEPNFTYAEPEYDAYADSYGTTDVFLSTSRLEGGPIPLLESMMANAVPVCSRTGFAPDVIDDGRNGFLFDIDATGDEVAVLVERAFSLTADVRATVVHRTWAAFATEVQAVVFPERSPGSSA